MELQTSIRKPVHCDGVGLHTGVPVSMWLRPAPADHGIVFVITDGEDNASTLGVQHVRAALSRAVTSEAMESLVSVLIGVNVKDRRIGGYLQDFKNEAGFTQYVEIGSANAKTLAKLADFVSRSISAQSQALGTGGSSQTLGF